jgi:hypothetical protein
MINQMRVLTYTDEFTDYTLTNEKKAGITLPEEAFYLYIAQDLPFNHVFIQVTTANTVATTVVIEHWDGTAWRACNDVLDDTVTSGKPLTTSGFLQWQIDDDYSPCVITDTSDSTATDLNGLKVYDKYWFRISYADVLDSAVLKCVRFQFTNSSIIKGLDIELDTYLLSFASGKTDWYDEISTASDLVVIDLKRMGLIKGYGNIISFDTIALITAYRTLTLIYFSLGPAYLERYKVVSAEYTNLLTSSKLTVDTDDNAKVSTDEVRRGYRRMVR